MEHLLPAFTTFAFKIQREPLMDTTTTKCLNGKLSCMYMMYMYMYTFLILDHIPSSCIVIMMHVVKGRQYSACIVHASMKWTDLRPTLDLSSDKSRLFNHRVELDSMPHSLPTDRTCIER
jgi:hypothetical protein